MTQDEIERLVAACRQVQTDLGDARPEYLYVTVRIESLRVVLDAAMTAVEREQGRLE